MSTDSKGGGPATTNPTCPAAAERRATDNGHAERLRAITAPAAEVSRSERRRLRSTFAGCETRSVDRPVGANTRFRSAACTRDSPRRDKSIAPLSRGEVSLSRARKRHA
jgi:hypothetical protein